MKKLSPLLWMFAIAAVAVIMLILPASSWASTIYWDFRYGESELTGSEGNSLTFTSSGPLAVDVTVTGWSENAGMFEKAFLGHYWSGLGVTNSNSADDDNGSDGQHTIDNIIQQDFVAFLFSTPVIPTDLRLRPFAVADKGPDSDFQAWVGQAPVGFTPDDLEYLTFAALDATLTRMDENKTKSTSTHSHTQPIRHHGESFDRKSRRRQYRWIW